MLSNARTCACKTLNRTRPCLIETAASQEPLLFLYPRWVQQAAHTIPRRHIHQTVIETPRFFHNDRQKAACTKEHVLSGRSSADFFPAKDEVSNDKSSSKPRPLNLNHIAVRPARDASPGRIDGKSGDSPTVDEDGSSVSKNARNYNPSGIDGLNLARKLASIANSPLPSSTETFAVSARFLEWYVGTSGRNMWFHRENSGCRIYVGPHSDSPNKDRTLVLEGSERSREQARRYLLDLYHAYKGRDNRPVTEQNGPDRQQTDQGATQTYVHVDQIPVPVIWTLSSFYSYVKAVLAQRAPKTIERSLYPGSNTFDKAASQLLMETFQSEALSQYQSVAALRLVLNDFRHRTQAATNVVGIWKSVIENGLVPDITCFNFEIERSIKVNNIDRMEYLLRTMALLPIKPDATTWAVLLRTLRTPAQRRNLINALLRSDHLTTLKDKDTITRALIVAEFKHVVALKDGIPRFAEWLHKRFGSEWLSPGAVCDMIDQCIKSTTPWRIHEVLDTARYFGITLEQLDATALLDIIRRTKHFGDMLWFFRSIPSSQDHTVALAQIDLLFKLAWSQKCFNTSRLIWQYAASRGLISHSMQRLVMYNLAMNQSPDTTGMNKHPLPDPRQAAVTIGTNILVEDFASKFPLLARLGPFKKPAELLCRWMPGDGSRHEQLQLAHLLLERDLEATKFFQPMRTKSFIRQLEETYKLDLQWKNDNYLTEASIADLLDKSVKVGLHPIVTKASGKEVTSKSTVVKTVIQAGFNLPSLSVNSGISAVSKDVVPKSPARKRDVEAASPTVGMLRPSTDASILTDRGLNGLEQLLQHLGQAFRAN